MNKIIVGGQAGEYVELAASAKIRAQGRLFKKKILHMGSFANPGDPNHKIIVDKAFADKLVENFANGVCDIVQVPMVNAANQHVENPDANIGRVVDVSYDDSGVYAIIDALKHADDLGKTLIGASASIHLNYKPNSDSEGFGPCLLHVAVTNRPYITKLSEFEEIGLSNADTVGEETVLIATEPELVVDTTDNEPIVLSGTKEEENPSMTKEELIAELKAKHGIDVEALETAKVALSAAATDKDNVELSDVAAALVELSAKNDDLAKKFEDQTVTLSNNSAKITEQDDVIKALVTKNDELELSAATKEVETLISEGRILPKQKDAMLKLSMKDRETFDALVPSEAIVSLSESGVTTHEETHSDKTAAAIERYRKMARGEDVE